MHPSQFPQIRVYNCQNTLTEMERNTTLTAYDSQRNYSTMNLMEKSLLVPATRSRSSGRRTHPDLGGTSTIVRGTKSASVKIGNVSGELSSFLPEIFEPISFPCFGSTNIQPDKTRTNANSKGPLSRVDAALAIVQKLKDIRRENESLGVPKDFSFADTGCLIIEEDEEQVRRRREIIRREQREMRNREKSPDHPKARSKTKEAPSSPRRQLSERADFSRQNTTISEVGVKWNIWPSSEHVTGEKVRKQKAWEKWAGPKPASCTKSRGTLCKVKYPLAEALTREGTSAEKRRGRTLQQGDWQIMKIWPRRADQIRPNILPIQMANEDIPLLRKIYELAKRYDDVADVRSLENDGHSAAQSSNEEKLIEDRSDASSLNSMASFQHDWEQEKQKLHQNEDTAVGQQRETNEDDFPAMNDGEAIVANKTSPRDEEENGGMDREKEATGEWVHQINDSQSQAESDETAKLQRSWLHLTSDVPAVESGGNT